MEITDFKKFLDKSKAEFDAKWEKPFAHPEKLEHFKLIEVLGAGMFGTVMLVKHKLNGEYCAMKALEKSKVMKYKSVERARNEKNILKCLNFPFTVYLKYFLMDNVYIYMFMPFVPGGELFRHLKKMKKLPEPTAKFYACQVVLVLEYLHHLKVIYRDVKLENILIDRTGFIKVTDFGLSKHLTRERTYTMCGTMFYLAPEILLFKGYGFAADWWAVGVLIYELVTGWPPFYGDFDEETCEKILTSKLVIPRSCSRQLKDLVKNMMQRDLTKRFGNLRNGVDDIKGHRWFREINWLAVLNKRVKPPFIPELENAGSTENFDSISEEVEVLRKSEIDEFEAEFANF